MQTKASQTGDLQVFEHHSRLGQWRFAQRRADPRLRGYVHGFVVSEGHLPAAVREWHIPSLEVAVVLNFASPHRVLNASDPKRATNYRSGWVVGLQSRHRLTEAVDDEWIQVQAEPGTFSPASSRTKTVAGLRSAGEWFFAHNRRSDPHHRCGSL